MPLHVLSVEPGSPAESVGIKEGSVLYSINSRHLEDVLDFYFLIEDAFLEIVFRNPDEEIQEVSYHNTFTDAFGLSFEAPECKECINNCVFCFVDQMPHGMRKSLYVKDDDFLFSFMYGNFITLTNLTDHYLNKMIEQHVSPLYVSVHSTNPELHQKMLRYKRSFNVIETLKKLADHEIEMQTQIVLVPDWNDKEELRRTLNDLTNPELNISSIGIVPVGLTRFRNQLSPLRSFTQSECRDVIRLTKKFRNEGYPYLYCSDEFFLQANMRIPAKQYYNDFEQIENGIGMVRKTWDNYRNRKKRFYQMVNLYTQNICFITGESGQKVLKPIVEDINQNGSQKENKIEKVENDFFGHSVTVSGLLTWTDVKKHIPDKSDFIYAFSDNFFNFEDITLDDFSIQDISSYLKKDFLIIDALFSDYRVVPYQER